uniref:Uncharacterized protein n=1 Tax=Oryza nivara TaxID=4536 RepID=A0A0E0HR81_ORYNI
MTVMKSSFSGRRSLSFSRIWNRNGAGKGEATVVGGGVGHRSEGWVALRGEGGRRRVAQEEEAKRDAAWMRKEALDAYPTVGIKRVTWKHQEAENCSSGDDLYRYIGLSLFKQTC